jgi:hypothetical protein
MRHSKTRSVIKKLYVDLKKPNNETLEPPSALPLASDKTTRPWRKQNIPVVVITGKRAGKPWSWRVAAGRMRLGHNSTAEIETLSRCRSARLITDFYRDDRGTRTHVRRSAPSRAPPNQPVCRDV